MEFYGSACIGVREVPGDIVYFYASRIIQYAKYIKVGTIYDLIALGVSVAQNTSLAVLR